MAQYKHTVNVNNNNPAVTIPGVDATAEIGSGDDFYINGEDPIYQVSAAPVYTNPDTTVTLTTNYGGITKSGATGIFQRDRTEDNIPIAYTGDLGLATLLGEVARSVQAALNKIYNGTKALTNILVTGGTLDGVTIGAAAPAESVASKISMNPSRLAEDTTIPTGYNAYSAGPIEVGEGVEVTINDNANWSVL